MDVDSKSDKKVSHQLSKLKLDDKAIEKVKSDNRANIPIIGFSCGSKSQKQVMSEPIC